MRQRLHVLRALLVACLIAAFAAPLVAQTGRIGGTVKDDAGQPIKGATVTAENPNASPSSITATTDDRGRFSVIGLRAGTWAFTAQAPGFQPSSGNVRVATVGAPNPPVDFTLARGPSGPAGAMAGVNTKELQTQLSAADALYNAAQYDQAIAAYEAILAKTPALTLINLQIGNAYRMLKQWDKALELYHLVLKDTPNDDRAKVAIGLTYLEKGDLATADSTLTEAAEGTGASREVFYNLGEVKFAKSSSERDDAARSRAIEDAVKWYQKASDIDPAWGKPLFKLGLVALNKGDKDGAIKMFEKVMASDPMSAEATQAKAVVEQLKSGGE